jgi:DNA sulfur modification protein DndC
MESAPHAQLGLFEAIGAAHFMMPDSSAAHLAALDQMSTLAPAANDPDAALARAEFKRVYDLSTENKVARAKAAIGRVFDLGHPVCCSWSAGKDSTVMLYLVLEVARERKERGASLTTILITHAQTQVDNPAYEQVANAEMASVRAYLSAHGLPGRVDVAFPSLNDTWAVSIIGGRVLPTFANSSARQCSIVLKLDPQERQRKAALKELSVAGAPVVMVGTRFDESEHRFDAMTTRGERDSDIWMREVRNGAGKFVRNELCLSPVCFFSQEDIWVILAELMSGKRASYTNAEAIWEAYRDGGNSSCAVVSDDTLKQNAKACGARFGCWSCAAVGRDKSLEAMIESDEKYAYMRGLNRLQRFIVDTQYDTSRRQWVGRTVTKDGYLAIGPDAYSPAMQRELLSYALTLDRDERRAAAKLDIKPRFTIVSLEQLIAIDIIWSLQGSHRRAFEAIHLWEDVNERGKRFYPPEVDASDFPKKIPSPKWLYVGADYDSDAGYSALYAGGRNILADATGATETGGCVENIELGNGNVMVCVETTPSFEVDTEGAELFMVFTVGEDRIHEQPQAADPGEAFRVYQMLGTFTTSRRHQAEQDYMLRRADWRRRHGINAMTTAQLLARCVSDAERAAGVRAPGGQATLAEDYQAALAAEHAQREATRWRSMAPEQCEQAVVA